MVREAEAEDPAFLGERFQPVFRGVPVDAQFVGDLFRQRGLVGLFKHFLYAFGRHHWKVLLRSLGTEWWKRVFIPHPCDHSANMVRILSIGSELDYAHHADWNESANIRDYDIVFVNLRDLERRTDEFLHANVPGEYRRQYQFPPTEHILQLLTSGGEFIVTLPSSIDAEPSENQDWEPPEPIPEDEPVPAGTPILNFFSWLPLELDIDDMGGESIDEETIDEDWEWYFDDGFSWDLAFSTRRDTTEHVRFRLESLVENRYGESLAAQITANFAQGPRTTGLRPDWGSIYLLPFLEGWGIENLVQHVMENLYPDVDIETAGRQPDWLADYESPRESELEEQISDLEQELAEAQSFERLLWEQDDELEEAVYETFRKAGLTVHDEVPHRRDGAIELDDRMIMLEITGTTGSVTERKLSQLQKWVTNNQDEFDKEVSGLFVINHFMETDPADRDLTLDPDRLNYLESAGLQLVTTPELFKMVNGLETDDLDADDVEAKLRSDSEVIQFDTVDDPS